MSKKNGKPKLADLKMFQQRAKRRYQELDIDGFGRVRLRDLSALEFARLTEQFEGKTDFEVSVCLAQHCVVDEEGEPIFMAITASPL